MSSPVVDQVGLLSWEKKKSLSNSLKVFHQKYGPQIALLVVPELGGQAIEEYSIDVVDKWKLGSKEKENGVLFLISIKDRKMRLEIGRGLEGKITDLKAGRIIESSIPFFKKKNYYSGILVVLHSVARELGGNLEKVPSYRMKKQRGRLPIGYFLTTFFLVFIFGRGGGFGRGLILGSLLGHRSYSRPGSGSFGGSGWSGGGGSFSGGGASGEW